MLNLRVINNGDHAALIWFPDDAKAVPACRGFALQRKLTRGTKKTKAWLHNFVGFADGEAPPPAGEEWRWPIQRYLWWDYGVGAGDTVSYRVVPVTGADHQHLALAKKIATKWSPAETISGQDGPAIEAYFNRGIIATQWVARALAAEAAKQLTGQPPTARAALMKAIDQPGNSLRNALSGLLRPRLLDLLGNAPGKVFAALYELNDPEVVAAFTALGTNCNLILANGAFKPPENDENAELRGVLRAAGKINLFDRLVTGAHFAHNKFVVFCDAAGAAQTVWTGSTNMTETGLCTQANNGIIIKDTAVADAFLQEWQRLKAAKNGYPATLAAAHAAKQTFTVPPGAAKPDRITVWFTPTPHGEDMVHARSLIAGAKDGIIFLNFNPGAFQPDPKDWTLLQSILNRHQPGAGAAFDPKLYIRGVVNQEIPKITSDPTAPVVPPVLLYDGGTAPPVRLDQDVLVPANIKQDYPHWRTELKGASSVMIHSKVVIIDPFGANPVVMTGSHNQGMKASRSNDDNLVIVEGNAALAQAYALNAIAIFQEYRWRRYVAVHPDATHARWTGLEDNDSWQNGHLVRDAAEMAFWLK